MTELSSDQICERADISYRQLDRWARYGVLRPIGQATPGSGAVRRWHLSEARVACFVGRLAELGATVPALELAAGEVRGWDDWTGDVVVSRTGLVGRRLYDSVTFGEACWIVSLELCAARVESERVAA